MKPKKIFLVLLTGAMIMFNQGCSPELKLEKYSSKDTELNISMDHISGWLYSETRGSFGSYAQVLFYEPERKDKKIKATMSVTVEKTQAASLPDIGSYAKDLVSKRMKFKDAKLIGQRTINLLNAKAISIDLSYRRIDSLNSIDAKQIPVKEKAIILQKNNKFYLIRYDNTAEEFDRFSKIFDRIVRSVKFK